MMTTGTSSSQIPERDSLSGEQTDLQITLFLEDLNTGGV